MQYIAPNPISCEQAYDTVAHYEKVALSEESEQRVAACRKFLDDKIAEIDRPSTASRQVSAPCATSPSRPTTSKSCSAT